MSEAFVIEVDGEALGLAVRDGRRFRFISSQPLLQQIDRKLYPSLRALRSAATEVYRSLTAGRRRPGLIRAF
ncbi:hypothetical protein [Desertibaculum subflavum]|uniref:hypothetical protein n=1 Tax=Desertibaculum subflavum TaxID=2268458 RepID=UPI000E66DA3E